MTALYFSNSNFFKLKTQFARSSQVQRLVAILSVPSVTRSCLLADAAPDLAAGALSAADAAVLRAAGWTPGGGLRSLLNFSGALRRLLWYTSSLVVWWPTLLLGRVPAACF